MELSVLKALLERWHIEIPKLDREDGLSERIKAQKLVHLLQNKLYKADLLYGYGMYIHGPYSPGLSRDYYELAARDSDISSGRLSEEVTDKVDEIRTDCEDFRREGELDEVLALEILGTTLFFAKGYSEPERVVAAVMTAKPKLKGREEEIKRALTFLTSRGYLRSEVE